MRRLLLAGLIGPRQPSSPQSSVRGLLKGPKPPYEVARILRDYLVRIEAGPDDLLLDRAFFVLAGRQVADSYFLIDRYRALTDAAALAQR